MTCVSVPVWAAERAVVEGASAAVAVEGTDGTDGAAGAVVDPPTPVVWVIGGCTAARTPGGSSQTSSITASV